MDEIPPLPGGGRSKDITLIWTRMDGYTWVPMWVCAFCRQGPITGTGGDDNKCCGPSHG